MEDQSLTELDNIYDYMGMESLIAVNKYSRLIRKAHILSELAENQEGRDAAKFVLGLDKQEIIDKYKELREAIANIKKSTPSRSEQEDIVKMLSDAAYVESARHIQDKLEIQVEEWISENKVMLFETLTISDENLNSKKIRRYIRSYKRQLRLNLCKYAIIFEKGEKSGRPHFHVIYNMNPRIGEKGHGAWQGGKNDVVRVRYLGDKYSNQNEMLLNGYSKDRIIGYLVKYLSVNKNDGDETDLFHFRTQLSRGFGTCRIREKLKKEKTVVLKKMVKSGLKPYKRIFLREVHLELARRLEHPLKVLKRDITSMQGVTVSSIVKGRRLQDGGIQEARRVKFKGYDEYLTR